MRLTKCRVLLLNTLAKAKAPLTADQLWLAVGRTAMDRVSVYRELATLTNRHIISTVRLGGRANAYELQVDGHGHHLVCLTCGAVDRMAMPNDLDHFERSIEKKKDFQVVRHALEFFGYCAKCR